MKVSLQSREQINSNDLKHKNNIAVTKSQNIESVECMVYKATTALTLFMNCILNDTLFLLNCNPFFSQ